MKSFIKRRGGFTLIEVLLVIAIIAILAAIVLVAINPAKQLAQSRNTQRQNNVNEIGKSVIQYSIDNQGNLPSTITTTATDICATGGTCTGLIDLSVVTTGNYIKEMPKDPKTGDTNNTNYQISADANGRITVTAPDAELGKTIQYVQ